MLTISVTEHGRAWSPAEVAALDVTWTDAPLADLAYALQRAGFAPVKRSVRGCAHAHDCPCCAVAASVPDAPASLPARPPDDRRSIEAALTSSAQFLESLLAENVDGQRIRLEAAREGVQRAIAFLAARTEGR